MPLRLKGQSVTHVSGIRCYLSLRKDIVLKKLHSAEGLEFAVNYPPATLFDQFLQERLYLKNVTPRTLMWYRVCNKPKPNLCGSTTAGDARS